MRRCSVQRFDGRTVWVTGASSGIGLAVARRVAEEGGTVVCTARTQRRLDEAVASLPGTGHLALAFDAANEDATDIAAARLRSEGRTLHAAVMCAGQHSLRPLQMLKAAHLDESLAANVRSAMLCTKMAVKLASREGCSIVWLSSAGALAGNTGEAAYAASKGALLSASRSLATELASRGIRVNAVAPGVVETPMSECWLGQLTLAQREAVRSRHLLGFGCDEDVAAAIAFLASDDARWITGTCLTVDGGLTCH
ncbi:MAG: SDR family oxidoreductase [Acidobacteriales bacterium]|nr:SDR family oxidoreductase [Terriglobales bacterium]